MVESSDFRSDWTAPHSLAFGAGAAIALGVVWLLRPAGVVTALNGPIGWVLLGGAIVTVFLSERHRETVRREPGYFVSGLAMGLVLAAKLFS